MPALAFGGVGPVVLRLPKTEEFLQGKPMLLEIFQEAGKLARDEISQFQMSVPLRITGCSWQKTFC